jgi:hypothetical protein
MSGMFSIGKTNPESNKVGSMSANADMNMATCWLLLTVDIMIPSESDRVMNRIVSATSKNKFRGWAIQKRNIQEPE